MVALPASLIGWLGSLACPVIALAQRDNVLAAACDVQVDRNAHLDLLLRNITRAPRGAALLVQVLRAAVTADLDGGLLLESLAYSTLQAGPEFRNWRHAHPAAPVTATDPGPPVRMDRQGGRLLLELDRPSRRNAMSVEMRDALVEALQLVLADTSIESILLTGRGRCFSAGGDLDEFGSAPDPATAHLVRCQALPGRLLAACADRATVRVHGACIGSGIEFPAFASRIEAASDAWFQLPELRYGLIPGGGGCVSVSRRIGRQRTAWMVLSGARIDARTALDWGLVDAIVEADPESR